MKYLSAVFLLPVYNSEKTIERTIKSILDQDYKEFKLMIIENGSTDSTWQILKKFQEEDKRIILFKLDNASLTHALCYGIKTIKEDLILRIDADDICESNRLSKTIEYMIKNPNVDIGYSDFEDIYKNKCRDNCKKCCEKVCCTGHCIENWRYTCHGCCYKCVTSSKCCY